MTDQLSCESCGKAPRVRDCGYCVACCSRWHYAEIGQGPVIHAAEAEGQEGR